MESAPTTVHDILKISTQASPTCWTEVSAWSLLSGEYVDNLYTKATTSAASPRVFDSNENEEQSWTGKCTIPNYEEDVPEADAHIKHLSYLIMKHAADFREYNKKFPAAILMDKRIHVSRVIMESIHRSFHTLKNFKGNSPKKNEKQRKLSEQEKKVEINETEILMEMSVKTLTAFLFSMLRMSWSSSDPNMALICTDVLQACSGMLVAIPPLSLANTAKLPKIANNCLNEVTAFLNKLLKSSEFIHNESKSYVCQILLGLGILRGNIGYLLEWIELCLVLCLENKADGIDCQQFEYWYKLVDLNQDVSESYFVLSCK